MNAATKVASGAIHAAADTARGLASKAAGLFGRAAPAASTSTALVSAASEVGTTAAKWGGMIEGAKTVGVVALIAGAAYVGYKALTSLFGGKEEPAQDQPGKWAANVGGSRGQVQGYAAMVDERRAMAAGQGWSHAPQG